jgi:FG-GAP-like repeat
VSGSYAPGDIYLFKGLGKGAFAEREKLATSNGESARAGLASSVAVADWDRDGRLDLIVGNIQGEVWWVRNESHDGKLVFGATKERLKAGNQPIATEGDAGPLVADWDGDGIADLLVGSSDGSVTFFKASGASGPPTLAPGVKLIAPLGEKEQETLRSGLDAQTGELVPPPLERSRIRSKVAVYDWNGDGKLDLLVGDFVSITGPDPILTAEQLQQRDVLQKQYEETSQAMSRFGQEATQRAKQELGIVNEWESSDAQQRVFNREMEILHADGPYRDAQKQSTDIWQRLSAFKPKYAAHGFVWVYLRK